MDKVSIVVPVFNGRQFLPYSLKSIYRQTYKNLELIIIDDGSSDGSYSFLKQMEKHSVINMKVYTQENQGIAYTRNQGIVYADGKYVLFMDQDDSIEPDYVETLVKEAEEWNADIVVSGYIRRKRKGRKKRIVSLKKEEWSKFMNIAPWGKIFRKDFIIKNQLYFLDVVKGEDCFFMIMAYSKTDKIQIIPYVGYHWIDQSISVTNTVYTKISKESSILYLFQALIKELSHNCLLSKNILEFYFIKAIIYDLLFSSRGGKKEDIDCLYDELFVWLRKNFPNYRKNKNISPF
ncbi:glycosyltransferase family 2 protein, partial [bacterium 1XD42-8]